MCRRSFTFMPTKKLSPHQRDEYLSRPLLTIEQAADFLNVSPDTIRRLLVKGELASVYVSARRVRILRAELDAYIERRTRRRVFP